MVRKEISSKKAVSIRPYSQGVDSDGLIFLSGQTPVDFNTGELVDEDIKTQTQQCFDNLFNVLNEINLTSDDVQKVNVFLTDMNDFSLMNEIYSKQFSEPYPARTTVGVTSLSKNAKVEIEMIARRR
ncbi:MAG: Rid family detoxifying hydrolase [Oscillospiraceae bacterium]|nr:Rid family detoxifying hydrolase [Oscillospiraceae bacterium]